MSQSHDNVPPTTERVEPGLSANDEVLLRQMLAGRALGELARLHRSDERRIAQRIRGLAERIAADGPRHGRTGMPPRR